MNLFFGKAKSKTTAKDSIVKLRETLSMLEKRQAHLETKAENEYKIAKLNATKNRRGEAADTIVREWTFDRCKLTSQTS